ncbi:hypothetical protein [Alkalicoccus daliensis]|uniref:DUF986 domain-containing protein n=1 Tax=Alkalicoccus daliensis TaxID=745820 RepID=A0A1H0CSX7_9BACI|nr:hypothetical protein [Alkalicoccus daliensis]SDN60979.1 hypothetical protein SAMN04488053_102220 [Alkalicoccus daliensis]
MQWLYLITAVVMSILAVYHLFTDRFRKLSGNTVLFELDDPKKISTSSIIYKSSIYACYIVFLLSILLFMQLFTNFTTATLLFVVVFLLGMFILLTLDKVFQVQGDAVIFAGYHAKWSKIRIIKWGKQRRHRRQLIMELVKGQRIKTTVPNEEKQRLENFLADYVYVEKEKDQKKSPTN